MRELSPGMIRTEEVGDPRRMVNDPLVVEKVVDEVALAPISESVLDAVPAAGEVMEDARRISRRMMSSIVRALRSMPSRAARRSRSMMVRARMSVAAPESAETRAM